MLATDLYQYVFIAVIIVAIPITWLLWRRFGPVNAIINNQLFEYDKRSFFGQLDIAVRSHLMVLPSLPVGDVLHCSKWGRAGAITNSKKNRRFDFVLYDRRKMHVCCAIVLIPYKTDANTKEFRLLRELCQAADLPLLEYDMKPWRDVPEMRQSIFATLGIADEGPPDFVIKDEPKGDPVCPKCQGPMTLRTLQKGARAGQRWWVCNTFPGCKGARQEARLEATPG